MIKQLKKLSPHPIRKTNLYNSTGVFNYGSHTDYKPYIEIDKSINKFEQITTLAHELGHAQHYKRKCICYRLNDKITREVHAIRFSLLLMLHYNLDLPLALEINEIESIVNNSFSMPKEEITARKIIMDMKVWERAKKRLKIA